LLASVQPGKSKSVKNWRPTVMRKDDSGIKEWCKHTRNANGYGRRGVNKRNRQAVKAQLSRGRYRGGAW